MKQVTWFLLPTFFIFLLFSQSASAQPFTCWEGESAAETFRFGDESLVVCGEKIKTPAGYHYIAYHILDENTGDLLFTSSGRNHCVISEEKNGLDIVEILSLPAGPFWESWGLGLWNQSLNLVDGKWKASARKFIFTMEKREDKAIEDFVNNEVKDFSGILADEEIIPMMKKLLVAALRGSYQAEQALWKFETHFGRKLDFDAEQHWKDYVSILHLVRQ